MPSESSFKHQAELARTALQNFHAIRQLDAPALIKSAIEELVVATADFQNFVPFFMSHALFLEIPPLVYSALEDFFSKNPNVDKPLLYGQLAGLNARVKDTLSTSAKKGIPFSYFGRPHLTALAFWFLAALNAANLRSEKKPRAAAKSTTGVGPFLFLLDVLFIHLFIG